MGYKVIIANTAKKQLARMDRTVQKWILQFLTDLERLDNPRLDGEALKGKGHLWKYRVGAYRVIAGIDDKNITITVVKTGHRSSVYK